MTESLARSRNWCRYWASEGSDRINFGTVPTKAAADEPTLLDKARAIRKFTKLGSR